MYNLLELYWLNVNLNPSVQKRFHQINHQFISKPIPMLKCTVEVLNIIIVIIIIIIVIITIKKKLYSQIQKKIDFLQIQEYEY